MEVYDDDEWEVPDPVSSFEDEVIENVDVQKFLSTLPEKDKTILQMRQDGYTLQEIADELEYKTHSAVLKRIKSIGRKYEKYSGLSFGFKRLP
jgi:DNA-directed RNA polymerase specialized sigma24 family protein